MTPADSGSAVPITGIEAADAVTEWRQNDPPKMTMEKNFSEVLDKLQEPDKNTYFGLSVEKQQKKELEDAKEKYLDMYPNQRDITDKELIAKRDDILQDMLTQFSVRKQPLINDDGHFRSLGCNWYTRDPKDNIGKWIFLDIYTHRSANTPNSEKRLVFQEIAGYIVDGGMRDGADGDVDFAKMTKLYNKAAEQGHAVGQNKLHNIYTIIFEDGTIYTGTIDEAATAFYQKDLRRNPETGVSDFQNIGAQDTVYGEVLALTSGKNEREVYEAWMPIIERYAKEAQRRKVDRLRQLKETQDTFIKGGFFVNSPRSNVWGGEGTTIFPFEEPKKYAKIEEKQVARRNKVGEAQDILAKLPGLESYDPAIFVEKLDALLPSVKLTSAATSSAAKEK